jgi:periplasmic divalent cation tolerance protein
MTTTPTPIVVVLVTAPVGGVAETLARGIIEQSLAACVNIVPGVTSVYRWQDRVEVEPEALLICKTTGAAIPALEAHIRAHHPYDTPEFVVLDPSHVEARYGAWLSSAVK